MVGIMSAVSAKESSPLRGSIQTRQVLDIKIAKHVCSAEVTSKYFRRSLDEGSTLSFIACCCRGCADIRSSLDCHVRHESSRNGDRRRQTVRMDESACICLSRGQGREGQRRRMGS